jgi:hypothetical protein
MKEATVADLDAPTPPLEQGAKITIDVSYV